MGRMDGKVVLITGGARGQGRSHAVTLAEEGADIVVTDICEPVPEVLPYQTATSDDLDETVRLVTKLDRRCIGLKADARDSEQMQAVVDQVISEFGRIDVLSVNHGVALNLPWDKQTDAMWDTVVESNLSAPWRAVRPVIPHMITNGGGSIVFTASTAAMTTYPSLSAYSAAKTGVLGLMRSLATELAQHWIRVNAILPGNTATPMLHNQAVIDMFTGGPGGTLDDMEFPSQATMLLPIPWLQPEDLSKALLFLASDDARYITGVALPVDGGTLAQPAGIPQIAAERLGELQYQLRTTQSS
ncbi:mycofactocin-coupled SDR family oxidoreductase [Rhodococcus opacus]|jgi:(+)-trans-carveol dehydrogenase|uniref:mycofactocin-coupled SDR family oxidoreductase n=1 Tax=Rhodococcus opacus TaxID=37919 RepID=UPI0024740936|nr:mycofactocin-coupled SDR family oxidoreductase [Rhodococcus opacus]MDH6292432.1 (+)-trans-carveol dehydrogenase [Rhodococcus opacus]